MADAIDFSCYQELPAVGPSKDNPNPSRSDKDRNFSLHGRIEGAWSVSQIQTSDSLAFSHKSNRTIRFEVAVTTPRDLLLRRLESQHASDKINQRIGSRSLKPIPTAQRISIRSLMRNTLPSPHRSFRSKL